MKTEQDNLKDIYEKLDNIETIVSINKKDILTPDETAKFLGVAKTTLYTMTSKRLIPYYKPSYKMVYFKKKEIENWMLQNRVDTRDEVDLQAEIYIQKHPLK